MNIDCSVTEQDFLINDLLIYFISLCAMENFSCKPMKVITGKIVIRCIS